MKKDLAGFTKRVVAGTLVVVAVVGVSAVTVHSPSRSSVACSLNNIQTDKATLFYSHVQPGHNWFMEQVLLGASESKTANENLKALAATL